jgi:hypothetical protein
MKETDLPSMIPASSERMYACSTSLLAPSLQELHRVGIMYLASDIATDKCSFRGPVALSTLFARNRLLRKRCGNRSARNSATWRRM